MTRHQHHQLAVAVVARKLRRLGARVALVTGSSVSLLCDGVPVGVRVATAMPAPHRVRVAGKLYRYVYRKLHFNLHAHAVKADTVQVWVLVGEVDGETRTYIVPADKLGGKTVQLLADTTSRRSLVSAYRDEWGVLVGAGRRRAA